MIFISRFTFISLLLFFATACSNVKTDQVSVLSEAELCDQVKQIIDQHKQGFSEIKGSIHVTKKVDVWDARYHLVGKACQVWRWSDGKQAYMCSLTMPDEEMASERYSNAVQFTQRCLGEKYQAEIIDVNNGHAVRTIFSRDAKDTVASVHRVKTQGVFKSEWTVYFFIGDRERSL